MSHTDTTPFDCPACGLQAVHPEQLCLFQGNGTDTNHAGHAYDRSKDPAGNEPTTPVEWGRWAARTGMTRRDAQDAAMARFMGEEIRPGNESDQALDAYDEARANQAKRAPTSTRPGAGKKQKRVSPTPRNRRSPTKPSPPAAEETHPDAEGHPCHGRTLGPYPWPRNDGKGTLTMRACPECGALWENDAPSPIGYNPVVAREANLPGWLYGVTAAAFGWSLGKALLLCGRSTYGLEYQGSNVRAGWSAYRDSIPKGGRARRMACATGPCVDGGLMPGEPCAFCGLFATNAPPDEVDLDALSGLVDRLMAERTAQESGQGVGEPDDPAVFASEWTDVCATDEDDATRYAAALVVADALGVADLSPWADGLTALLDPRHADADRNIRLKVQVEVDKPTTCSLATYLKTNRESMPVAYEVDVRRLQVGQSVTFGGGADARVKITRIA